MNPELKDKPPKPADRANASTGADAAKDSRSKRLRRRQGRPAKLPGLTLKEDDPGISYHRHPKALALLAAGAAGARMPVDGAEAFLAQLRKAWARKRSAYQLVAVPPCYLDKVVNGGEPIAARAPERTNRLLKAYADGTTHLIPPVDVCLMSDGQLEVGNGIHRICVARQQKAPAILVCFAKGI